MITMVKPTQTELKEFLSYDPTTGYLIWIKKLAHTTVIGSRAGSLSKSGYRRLTFRGRNYQEHHIIWCIVYGQFPVGQIDHENQIRDCNVINNLREVTKAENARNRSRISNHLDEAGIWYCKRRKRYIAEITYEGKKVFQKSYIDIEDAIKERKAKALELGFHDNHGKSNNSNRKFYD